MSEKFLSSEAAINLLDLASSSSRPREIVELKEAIEGETRAAEINASIRGVIGQERVVKIVEMRLRLDGLYVKWAKGELE